MVPKHDAPEPELRDYLKVLRRRKAIIALATVVVVGAALAASALQTPVYQATAQVLLQEQANTPFNPNTGQFNNPTLAVNTQIQVIESRPIADAVRAKLGAAAGVSASQIGQTDVIAIKAQSTIPAQASAVANAYARGYIDFRRTQSVDDQLAAATQIQNKITDLQRQIDALSAEIDAASPAQRPSVEASVGPQRDSLLNQQGLFKEKLSETQVDASLTSGSAQLITPAATPGVPIKPRPRRDAVIALAVGLMFGIGLAFLFEYLDDSIRSKDDLDRASHAQLPTLGLIPSVAGWKDKHEARVASLVDPKSPTAEAYRSLRTSIQFLGLDRPVRVVQITSPSASEGKTTTLANLGVALARAGQRTVISCSDLRRPRIHEFFGLPNDVGLTSVIVGEVPLSTALQPVPEVEGLFVLASGPLPPNPSELLSSSRAAEVLSALRAEFDMVLVDSPPVLPVTDAAVSSSRVDATLLVATAGMTTRREVARAVELLRQVDAPLVGAVLNGVTGEGGYGYAYGYGRYSSRAESGNGAAGNGATRKAARS